MLEKARAKNKKPKSSAGISSIPNITVGTQVRNLFIYFTFILPGNNPIEIQNLFFKGVLAKTAE